MQYRHAATYKILASLLVMVTYLVLGAAYAQQSNTVTTVTYVYTDAQGSVLAEADAQGNITARYTYRPYGTQQTGPTNDGPGYTGHVHDPATGLVYMRQRYYNPATGRFISPDPISPTPENVFNIGRYTYANDNPYKFTDPDGRSVLLGLAGVLYETGSWVSGHGFHGKMVAGAFANGYNGKGPGVAGALKQDAGLIVAVATVGMAAPEVAGAEITPEVAGESIAEGGAEIESSVVTKGAGLSKYEEATSSGSRFINRIADVTKSDFEKNLSGSGWRQTVSKDGKVSIFEKDGAKYVVRDGAKSTGGPTADFYKAGSKSIDVKIRLGSGRQ